MSNRIDYRSLSSSDLTQTIRSFKNTSKLYNEVLNGLLAVAVYHSIKDGQVTPANNLLDACVPSVKDRVSLYLTKYGNIRYTEKQGFISDKRKNQERYGKEAADTVFLSLPDLDEAFPAKPRQYRDMDILAWMKAGIERAREVQSEGKAVIACDDEVAELFGKMEQIVASYAKG